MKVFFLLFGFYNVILACKLYPCYLPFVAIFSVILPEYSKISLIWCFFSEESSWFDFSVTHESIQFFFWLMKVEFDVSMEKWHFFPHYGKTKKKFRNFCCFGCPKMMVSGGWKNNNRKAHIKQTLFANVGSKLFSYSKPWKSFPTISFDGHNKPILYITFVFKSLKFLTISDKNMLTELFLRGQHQKLPNCSTFCVHCPHKPRLNKKKFFFFSGGSLLK